MMAMAKICDNKSVGQIIRNNGEILLIERFNYPQAYALPAGHLDGDNFELAAARETKEEVGIFIEKNKKIWEGTMANQCKREGGSSHSWAIFEAEKWVGHVASGSDAKKAFWSTADQLKKIASRTEYFLKKYGLDYVQVDLVTKKIFGDPAKPETDPEWQADK